MSSFPCFVNQMADFSCLRKFTRSLLPLSSPASSGFFLTVAFFRKPEIGTGHLPLRGIKCACELEDSKISIAEPSVGQWGF